MRADSHILLQRKRVTDAFKNVTEEDKMKVGFAGHVSDARDEEVWNGLVKETLEGCLPPQAVVEAGCDSNYRILYGASAAGATAITDSHADKGQRAGGIAVAVLVLHFCLVRAPPYTD